MQIITEYGRIDKVQWRRLVDESPVATWFQTQESYDFFASLPGIMLPFVVAVSCETSVGGNQSSADSRQPSLKGLIVGYVTREKSTIKQFFTRRAIIIGGPLLAEDITDDELRALLSTLDSKQLSTLNSQLSTPIYIETRNFNDYSRWRNIFEQCGFAYQPHLNFHVDTTTIETAQANIGKHRWKYIRLSIRDGAELVEQPTIQQVREFYDILHRLYVTKVHTPLFPWEFFEKLYYQKDARYILVTYNEHIVGGTLCMCLQDKALYEWFACGDDTMYKGIRPSSVATWFGMRYAAENGYPLFDLMGAGKPDEPYGVRDFKAEFGGKLVEYGRFLCVAKPLLYNIGKVGVRLLKR